MEELSSDQPLPCPTTDNQKLADKVGIEPTTRRLTVVRSAAELHVNKMEGRVGLEPTTSPLTKGRSTLELPTRINWGRVGLNGFYPAEPRMVEPLGIEPRTKV